MAGDEDGMRALFMRLYDPAAPRLSRDPGHHTSLLRFVRTHKAIDLFEAHYAHVTCRPRAAGKRPLVVVPSQPRSASRYVVDSLRRLYDLPALPTIDFPVDGLAPTSSWTILRRRLSTLRRVGGLPHCHAAASPRNLETLRSVGVDRLCVTVRDPRQGFYSEMRPLIEPAMSTDIDELLPFGLHLTREIAQSDRPRRAEMYLRSLYPDYLRWLHGWITAADSDPRIRLMRFKDMVRDPDRHLRTIGRHYGLEPVQRVTALSTTHPTRRKGAIDEFRRALPPRLLGLLQDMTPQALLDRMDWPR